MATERTFIIGRYKSQSITLHRQTKHLSRLRLSIAPSQQAEGAVGNSGERRQQRTAVSNSKRPAKGHEVPFSILVIRTLTKTDSLIGDSL